MSEVPLNADWRSTNYDHHAAGPYSRRTGVLRSYTLSPRTLQSGPTIVLVEGAFSRERGTPWIPVKLQEASSVKLGTYSRPIALRDEGVGWKVDEQRLRVGMVGES